MPVSSANNRGFRSAGAPTASNARAAETKQSEKFVEGQVSIETFRKDGQLRWDVTFENQGSRPFVGTIAFAGSAKNAGEGFESMPLPDREWKATQHISAHRDHGVTPRPGELLRLQVRGYSHLEVPLPEEGKVQLSLDQFERMPAFEQQYFEPKYVQDKVTEKSSARFEDGCYKIEFFDPAERLSAERSTVPNQPLGHSLNVLFSPERRAKRLSTRIRGDLTQRADGAFLLKLATPFTAQIWRVQDAPPGFKEVPGRDLLEGQFTEVLLTDALRIPLDVIEQIRERGSCEVELKDFHFRDFKILSSFRDMEGPCALVGKFSSRRETKVVLPREETALDIPWQRTEKPRNYGGYVGLFDYASGGHAGVLTNAVTGEESTSASGTFAKGDDGMYAFVFDEPQITGAHWCGGTAFPDVILPNRPVFESLIGTRGRIEVGQRTDDRHQYGIQYNRKDSGYTAENRYFLYAPLLQFQQELTDESPSLKDSMKTFEQRVGSHLSGTIEGFDPKFPRRDTFGSIIPTKQVRGNIILRDDGLYALIFGTNESCKGQVYEQMLLKPKKGLRAQSNVTVSFDGVDGGLGLVRLPGQRDSTPVALDYEVLSNGTADG